MVGALIVVGTLIVFDIVTGLLKAGYQKKIQSTMLRKGLYHKISEIFAIALSVAIEFGSHYVNFGFTLPVSPVVITYISVMESISIIENICEINPELLKFFQKYLDKKDGENDD